MIIVIAVHGTIGVFLMSENKCCHFLRKYKLYHVMLTRTIRSLIKKYKSHHISQSLISRLKIHGQYCKSKKLDRLSGMQLTVPEVHHQNHCWNHEHCSNNYDTFPVSCLLCTKKLYRIEYK